MDYYCPELVRIGDLGLSACLLAVACILQAAGFGAFAVVGLYTKYPRRKQYDGSADHSCNDDWCVRRPNNRRYESPH